ncbi:MAG TPA: hypothetical protein PK785_05865, partial [Bacteroidales bacterium]|nr:hypothetical protein [Bacteroidales bacterium]
GTSQKTYRCLVIKAFGIKAEDKRCISIYSRCFLESFKIDQTNDYQLFNLKTRYYEKNNQAV